MQILRQCEDLVKLKIRKDEDNSGKGPPPLQATLRPQGSQLAMQGSLQLRRDCGGCLPGTVGRAPLNEDAGGSTADFLLPWVRASPRPL